MAKDIRIGEVNDLGIFRDCHGDLYIRAEAKKFYFHGAGYTVEETVRQLRAAAQGPRERVIAAARAYVADGCCDTEELERAVEALEGSEEAGDDVDE